MTLHVTKKWAPSRAHFFACLVTIDTGLPTPNISEANTSGIMREGVCPGRLGDRRLVTGQVAVPKRRSFRISIFTSHLVPGIRRSNAPRRESWRFYLSLHSPLILASVKCLYRGLLRSRRNNKCLETYSPKIFSLPGHEHFDFLRK